MSRGLVPLLALLAVSCAHPRKAPWRGPGTPPPGSEAPPPVAEVTTPPGQQKTGDELVVTIESGQGGPEEPLPPTSFAEAADMEGSISLVDPELPIIPSDGMAYTVMQWPLPATGVTSLFGKRTDPVTGASRFHYGIDLQGRYGQVVQSAADGVVVFAGWNAGHGRMVIVNHRGGWRTSYSHLSQVLVMHGVRVVSGQPVGLVGNSGRSTGPHLHFEVTRYSGYFDPLDILGTPVPLD